MFGFCFVLTLENLPVWGNDVADVADGFHSG